MMKPLFALALLSLFVGCEKKETPPTGDTRAATAATSAAMANATTAGDDDGAGIPTEEDFEDEAEQKITSANADEELDKLEKEISD